MGQIWEKVKRLCKLILFDIAGFALIFWTLQFAVGKFGLKLREWVNIGAFAIIFFGGIAGIVQLVLRVKRRWLRVFMIALLLGALILSAPYLYLMAVFGLGVTSEHVTVRDGRKYVAYVTAWFDTWVEYYEYKNSFVRGAEPKIYERYDGCCIPNPFDGGSYLPSGTLYYGESTDLSSVRIDGLCIGGKMAEVETEKYTPSDRFPEKEGTYNFEELRIETAGDTIVKITADFSATEITIGGQPCPASCDKIQSALGDHFESWWYDREQNLRVMRYLDNENELICDFIYDNSSRQIVWIRFQNQ